jgi:ATP phosphoribosyltransferase
VVELCDLIYSKAGFTPTRVVLAVADDSAIHLAADLAGKRIASEYIGLTNRWLARSGVSSANVEFSWGACEAKVPELADAIVTITETGSSLRAHRLRVLETLLESTPRLFGNRSALQDPWKRRKAENIAILLQGALQATFLVGLKMNVERSVLNTVLATLPAMKNPTISPLADPDWVAVETILDQHLVRDLIPRLKRVGARDIVEYPLNKVIY